MNGSVIGVDRTFNLGACYVTSMVYTNPNMLKKGKSTSPDMQDPVFLYWDGTYATYCEFCFFSKSVLALGLTSCRKANIRNRRGARISKGRKKSIPRS